MKIRFQKSNVSATWEHPQTLLDVAEEAGLFPEYSCREAFCGTCANKLISGEVGYYTEPFIEMEEDQVLLCQSYPKGDSEVVIDI